MMVAACNAFGGMTLDPGDEPGKKGILVDTKCKFSFLVLSKGPDESLLVDDLVLSHVPIDVSLDHLIDLIGEVFLAAIPMCC